MREHMGVFVILGALCFALMVLLVVKVVLRPRGLVGSQGANSNSEDDDSREYLDNLQDDDIIQVRKKTYSVDPMEDKVADSDVSQIPLTKPTIVTLHVMAQSGGVFKGYELLQALLSQGLRFGDMNIFHRCRQTNGRGPKLFSLASAVEPGTFDIHSMGTFECPGLTLFFQASDQAHHNLERFEVMAATARALAKELKGVCIDHQKREVTDATMAAYRNQFVDITLAKQCAN